MDILKIDDSNKNYPNSLKAIKKPPQVLYMQGNLELLKKKCVAIVGSRDCTDYGYKYAKMIAEELSKHDICIISGLAKRNRQ